MPSPAPKRIEIPRYPAGKRIAATFSFDDGTIFDRDLIELFNRLGLRGTWNLNSGTLGSSPRHISREEVAPLFAGHEVAIHTVTHPWLERLEETQIATEVLDDRRALEDLAGYPVRGMAYPFGTYNARVIEVLRALRVEYSRTVAKVPDPYPAGEPLAWGSSGHQYQRNEAGQYLVPQEFVRRYEKGESFCLYVWGHSYEFEGKWADAEAIFTPLAGKSDVWYCTNIELWDYAAARKAVVVAANRRTAYNPSAIPVTLKVDGREVVAAPGAVTSLAG